MEDGSMTDGVDARLDRITQMNRQAPDAEGLYRNPSSGGVTMTWLAQVFNMSEVMCRTKLRNCPPMAIRKRGTKMLVTLYDIKEAARYLVTPALRSEDYLKALKRAELPPELQQTVWDALLKRQKWEENAGELWRTTKVREVLGSTFQTIKFTTQLWTDTIERETGITQEQREILLRLSDGLLSDIYDALVIQATDGGTGSQLEEISQYTGETQTLEMIEAEEEEIAGLV